MQEDIYNQGEGEALGENIAERDEYWLEIDEYVANNLSDYLNGEEPTGVTENLDLDNFISGGIEEGSGSHEDIINQGYK